MHWVPDGSHAERMVKTGTLLARGVVRFLRDAGYGTLTEFRVNAHRRVDVIGIGGDGRITVVEVKSSEVDFRTDDKWRDYVDYCDRFYFAVPEGFPRGLIPGECGLLVTDAFGAVMFREASDLHLSPIRRKALLIRFARTASRRLHMFTDPDAAPDAGSRSAARAASDAGCLHRHGKSRV